MASGGARAWPPPQFSQPSSAVVRPGAPRHAQPVAKSRRSASTRSASARAWVSGDGVRQHRPSHTPPNWKNVDTLCAAKVVAIHLDPLWPLERFTKIAGRAAAAAPPTRSTVRRMGEPSREAWSAHQWTRRLLATTRAAHMPQCRCRPMPRGSGTRQGTDCMCAPCKTRKPHGAARAH